MPHITKLAIATSIATVLALGACTNDASQSPSEENRFIEYGIATDIRPLDPHTQNIVINWRVGANIYDRLIEQDENLELQPSLATDWEMLDELTWEFSLREDVVFHDGNVFDAEAVKANFERNLADETTSPTAYLFQAVEEVEVIDPSTVRFHLNAPFASLPAHLSHHGASIISPEVIAEDNEAVANGEAPGSVVSEKPIGTGPFQFESWTPDEELVLTANDDYRGGAPQVAGVRFTIIPDAATRLANLQSGNSDIIDAVSPSSMPEIEGDPDINVIEVESTYVNFLAFNTNEAPFDDVRIRQAFAKAIDKNEIFDGIVNGYGSIANSPLSPFDFGFTEIDGLSFDPDEAKALLAEAGYGEGDLDVTLTVSTEGDQVNIATYIQHALAEIGVNVEIEQIEFATFVEYTGEGKTQMFLLGRSSPTGDGYNGFFTILHSNKQTSNQIRYPYANQDLDQLIDATLATEDEAERSAYFKEAQQLVAEAVPFHFLYYPSTLTGVSNELEGVNVIPTGVVFLKDAAFTND